MIKAVSISGELKEKNKGIKLGFLFAENIKVVNDSPLLANLRRETAVEIQTKDYSHYLEEKNIKGWLEQFKKMGLNPNQTTPAQVAMIKRICKGGNIPNINVMVDLANIMAVKSKLPVGAFDLDKIVGDITLRNSMRGEKYLPLFETAEEEVPCDEIVYSDNEKIFSRYSKDCDQTKITSATTRIFFVIDGIQENPKEEIAHYLDELESLLIKHLQADVKRKEVIQ